jgi:ornithine cyclodeaminase/alanine dehydrogenase-like protein (mu-crystallin family)
VAAELGQVVLGKVEGRTDSDQITLFKSVGLAMQDSMTAARVYQLATHASVGTIVTL